MNLATMGVIIDPAGAVSGGAIATQASEKMAGAMTADAAQVAQATKQSSEVIVAAANTTAAAQTKAATAATTSANTQTAAATRATAAATTSANTQVAAATRAAAAAQAMASTTNTATVWERMQASARAASATVGTAFDRLRQSTTSAISGVNNSLLSVSVSAVNMANRVTASIGSMVSSGFNSLRSGASSMASSATSAFAAIRTAAVNTATSAGNSIAAMVARIKTGLSSFGHASSLTDLANSFGLMNTPIGNLISRLSSLRSVITSIPGWVAPVLGAMAGLALAFGGVVATYKLTMAAIDAAGPVQRMQMGLATVTGSAGQANAVITALRENALKTGSDLQASLSTSTKFIGMGFSPADAVKMNTSIQDIAGTLGLSRTAATELGNALVQVQSKGVVSMEELRQQIAEKGIPVFDELAKKMGKSTGELIDMVSKGKVPAKQLIDIFLNLEGGFAKFAGGAERATQTMPGAVDRLKAVWNDLLITMGTPINDALAPVVNKISTELLGLSATSGNLGESIAAGITAAAPTVISFFETIAGKVRGLLSMMNNENGFWTTWAANIWTSFVSMGLSAIQSVTAGFQTLGQMLLKYAVDFIEMIATVTTPEFWQMMGGQLSNIGIMFENAMRAAAEGFINLIRDNTPSWLKSGDNTRADFGRLAVPTIPTANIVAPDLFNDNNSTDGWSQRFKKNTEGMKGVLDETRQYWEQWGNDWNKQQLKPAADKVKTTEALSTKSGLANTTPFDKDAGKAAEKLQKQMEASAKKYVESSRTALQTYAATINEINTLQRGGFLTTEQAAAASGHAVEKLNEATKAAALKAASPMEKLIMQWGTLKNQIGEANATMTQSFTNNFASAVSSIVSGTASASQAWHTMTTAIIGDITQTIVKLAIQWAIQQALGLITGTAVPTTYTGATANAAAGVAGVHHTGGTVGNPSMTRTVPAAAFAGARKYQHGGQIPGIASGERAIIAEPGETVQTAQQSRDIRARLGDKKEKAAPVQVHVANLVDPAQIAAYFAQNPGAFLNVLSQNKAKAARILNVTQ